MLYVSALPKMVYVKYNNTMCSYWTEYEIITKSCHMNNCIYIIV